MKSMKMFEYASSLYKALGVKAEWHAAQQAIKCKKKMDYEQAKIWERIRLIIRQQKGLVNRP